jgi:hypothetical protein
MMENPWDSKPSKIQTFFQISITALAFLAFAGYLLCMIVQAIKAKRKSTHIKVHLLACEQPERGGGFFHSSEKAT